MVFPVPISPVRTMKPSLRLIGLPQQRDGFFVRFAAVEKSGVGGQGERWLYRTRNTVRTSTRRGVCAVARELTPTEIVADESPIIAE